MVSRRDNITEIPDVESSWTRVYLNEVDATQAIGTYIEQLIATTAMPVGAEIDYFFLLIKDVLNTRQDTEGVAKDKRINFFEEDPPGKYDTETITAVLEARTPGQMSQGAIGTNKVREVRPHQRAIREHPEHPGEKLVTMGRFFDNWITFSIYARTSKVALQRMLWFEHVMDSFNWYFNLHGYKVIESEVRKREKVNVGELTLIKYPMSYFVKTNDTYHFGSQELKRLVIKADVQTN